VKIIKTLLFCFACLLVFLATGAMSCVVRAKYSTIPMLKADFAYMYSGSLQRYALLQSSQTDDQHGKKAQLLYLTLVQRIRNEGIKYPQNQLHGDAGMAYLRLYRIESTAGNFTAAADYMKSAQKEFSALGWKDERISSDALAKLIEARETNEAKLYKSNVQLSREESGPSSQ
jgi:hypothetical protein